MHNVSRELPDGVRVVTCDVAATPGNAAGELASGRGRAVSALWEVGKETSRIQASCDWRMGVGFNKKKPAALARGEK